MSILRLTQERRPSATWVTTWRKFSSLISSHDALLLSSSNRTTISSRIWTVKLSLSSAWKKINHRLKITNKMFHWTLFFHKGISGHVLFWYFFKKLRLTYWCFERLVVQMVREAHSSIHSGVGGVGGVVTLHHTQTHTSWIKQTIQYTHDHQSIID